MSWIDGQVAMITGGGSGLGRALVRRFLEENASVAVLERSPAKAADLRREFGGDVVVVEGDAASLAENRKAVAETVHRFGKLDTLIANAGIWDHNAPLADMADDTLDAAFDELFHINVKAYLAAAKAAVPELAKTRGSIVFTGSNACFYPGGGGPLYTASKHAVLGLMRQLAYELGPEIRVNGVAPCAMASDLRGPRSLGLDTRTLADTLSMQTIGRGLPIQFVPDAEDFTGSYVLLASKHNSRTITGTMLHADGGLVARGLRKPIANFQPEPVAQHGG